MPPQQQLSIDQLCPELRTPNLQLRPVRADDALQVADLLNDFETARFLARVPHPYTERDFDQFREYLESCQNEWIWAIAPLEAEATIMGMIGLSINDPHPLAATLGFWLGYPYRRKGIMTEAVSAVLDHTAEVLIPSAFYAGHFDDNTPSAQLQERFGFKVTERNRVHCLATGEDRPHTVRVLHYTT